MVTEKDAEQEEGEGSRRGGIERRGVDLALGVGILSAALDDGLEGLEDAMGRGITQRRVLDRFLEEILRRYEEQSQNFGGDG